MMIQNPEQTAHHASSSADGNELIRYLKERRLYLNDPVDAEEDA